MIYTSIIFVHSGRAAPPSCMIQSVIIAHKITTSNIVILLSKESHFDVLDQIQRIIDIDFDRFKLIAIEDIYRSENFLLFSKNSSIDRNFRDGFWFETANRFFLIADYMDQYNLSDCIHIENDVVIYFDPELMVEKFREFAKFAAPFDRTRVIPGILWYSDAGIASKVAKYFCGDHAKPDFDILREFCEENYPLAKPLPTMPSSYVKFYELREIGRAHV